MQEELDELRRLTVPCQAKAKCAYCDARWDKIKEVAYEIEYRAVQKFRGVDK